jgi:hypothetical protein
MTSGSSRSCQTAPGPYRKKLSQAAPPDDAIIDPGAGNMPSQTRLAGQAQRIQILEHLQTQPIEEDK